MTLPIEEAKKFEEMLKSNPNQMYAKTIQVLMDIYHEDRLVIFTLLSVVGGYMQGVAFSEEERNSHLMMLEQLYTDFDIHEPEDLITHINSCMVNISNSKMRHTVGGVQ